MGSLEQGAQHDEIYDAEYFAELVDATRGSADTIAESLIRDLRRKSAIDVGCGTGLLLAALKGRGVQVLGLEYARVAIQICVERGVEVRGFDIENDDPIGLEADVVISTEVAEHLPEQAADRFVDLLTSLSNTIVLSAAVPGQGGTDHRNEQPNDYWVEKFEAHGCRFDKDLTRAWRRSWNEAGVASCFAGNVMVFRRGLVSNVD